MLVRFMILDTGGRRRRILSYKSIEGLRKGLAAYAVHHANFDIMRDVCTTGSFDTTTGKMERTHPERLGDDTIAAHIMSKSNNFRLKARRRVAREYA